VGAGVKLKLDHILERVARTETDRSQYNTLADSWEKMWRLEVFSRTPKEMIEQHGQEQVTLPTPFNAVMLAQGLISTVPKIDVPPSGIEDKEQKGAAKLEKWLAAAWQQVDRQQSRNVLSDAAWQTLVLGRNVFEVKWIGNELPKKRKKNTLPILIRTLDPRNVGIKRGPLYNLWGFHKYQDERINVMQRYPDLKLDKSMPKSSRDERREDEEVTIVDFWYISPEDGAVWNAIIANDEFAKPPTETDYPDIPFIESYGDSAPLEEEKYRGLSILHSINELWRYQCRLASQMGTGLLYYFWPPVTIQNEFGQPVDNIKVQPGEQTAVPWGTKIDMHQLSPNVPLAQAMMDKVDAAIQQSTFPGVMYGDGGNMEAGFGVSLLSESAKRRIKQPLENLEFALVRVNALMLGLIEEMSDEEYPDGIEVWGTDAASKKPDRHKLKAEDVKNFHDVVISLKPQVPQDMMQQQTLGLRLIESKVISRDFYRQHFLGMPISPDEVQQIEFEGALEAPPMQPIVAAAALRKVLGDDWSRVIGADQPLDAPFGPPKPPPPPPGAMPPGGPMPPPQGPPGPPMPPQGPPGPPPEMMGPPPGMPPQGGPPMPPGMENIPPEILAQMMAQGGPPPGMGGPPGIPPGQSPQMLTPPMGGGIPAEMQGMLTPEGMNMPSDTNPMVFADMTGQNIPPNDELKILAGQKNVGNKAEHKKKKR
jgi:hypothetical protein